MSKLIFFFFAILIVSVVCDEKAEREARKKLEKARANCVASINRASKSISQKYHGSVNQLATLEEQDAFFEIVKDSANKLNALIPVARSADTLEVVDYIKTPFDEVVNCSEELALAVSEIAYQAVDRLDSMLENTSRY